MSTPDAIARLQALIAERPILAEPLKGLSDPAIGAENGITIEAADLRAYFQAAIAKARASGDLSDAQLDGVAGGGVTDAILLSVFTLGLGCATVSAIAASSYRNCENSLKNIVLFPGEMPSRGP